MKKLLLILLFSFGICDAQQNLFVRQNFSEKVTSWDYNYYVTGDTDAAAYISASGISGTATVNSTYHIFWQLKQLGLYSKINAFWLFKGTTSTMQKYNAKNPLDTDVAFRLTFTGAATFSDDGYQLNGTSYANTHFNTSTQFGTTNYGITMVCGTNNAAYSADVYEYGTYGGISNSLYGSVKIQNIDYKKYIQAPYQASSTAIGNESRGIISGNNVGGVSKLWWNKVFLANGSTSGANALPNLNFFIGAVNLGGSPYGNSNQRIQMMFLHNGMTDADIVILHNIIDASENIAGRKTW